MPEIPTSLLSRNRKSFRAGDTRRGGGGGILNKGSKKREILLLHEKRAFRQETKMSQLSRPPARPTMG